MVINGLHLAAAFAVPDSHGIRDYWHHESRASSLRGALTLFLQGKDERPTELVATVAGPWSKLRGGVSMQRDPKWQIRIDDGIRRLGPTKLSPRRLTACQAASLTRLEDGGWRFLAGPDTDLQPLHESWLFVGTEPELGVIGWVRETHELHPIKGLPAVAELPVRGEGREILDLVLQHQGKAMHDAGLDLEWVYTAMQRHEKPGDTPRYGVPRLQILRGNAETLAEQDLRRRVRARWLHFQAVRARQAAVTLLRHDGVSAVAFGGDLFSQVDAEMLEESAFYAAFVGDDEHSERLHKLRLVSLDARAALVGSFVNQRASRRTRQPLE